MHCTISILLSLSLLLTSVSPNLNAGTQQPSTQAKAAAQQFPISTNADTQRNVLENANTQPPILTNADAGTEPPSAGEVSVSAPSVVLMEASTAQVIYEKDSHTSLHPASITKIMTMILIFDALAEGKISLEDTVTVSEYAASMGGSQVFLEPGETQTVDTMLKCISVASANDACVAIRYSRH